MIDPAKVAIRASTQQYLNIEDILDDLVILKDGGACLVIVAAAINFGLLSEKEQDATIYAYASLLNSLTFPIQIVIRSQKKDISAYIKLLGEAEAKETRPKNKEQIRQYRNFVTQTVQKNEVLDKKFYLTIPMTALELGITQGLTAGLAPKKGLSFEKNYILERAKINLYPKRDHLFRLLARLGLKSRQLNTTELIQLFFTIYNPESPGQGIVTTEQYEAPLVQSIKPLTDPPTGEAGVYKKINDMVAEGGK